MERPRTGWFSQVWEGTGPDVWGSECDCRTKRKQNPQTLLKRLLLETHEKIIAFLVVIRNKEGRMKENRSVIM
jgi:hypothetical protein